MAAIDERYSRQVLYPGIGERGQSRLAGAHVAVVGCGATGAAAASLLARAGFNVVASTGKAGEGDYLESLGAGQVMDRNQLSQPGRPMQKERWAAVVDSVGSHTLANACAQTRYRGLVAACGLAQGMDFPASVAPFILRGVSLLGIDSVMAPREQREPAWNRLARDLEPAALDRISKLIGLGEVVAAAQEIVSGKVRGRIVVDVNR